MRVLVLGAGGFLGGEVAALLRSMPGVQLLTGGRSADADLTADLARAEPRVLADAFASLAPAAVVNCAGAVGGSAGRMAEVNARGPAVLCEALAVGAPHARLVHLGSAAEYGPTPPGEPVAESAPTTPVAVYGATKLAGTLAVTASGVDAVVLRVFNPVGPGAPDSSLPGRLAAELGRVRAEGADGTEGTVTTGDLSAYRDFVDARDVAHAVALAATAPAPLPPVLNIGSGQATSVRELVHQLARAAGFHGRIEESGAGSDRSAAVSWQCADPSAAQAALGWRPQHTLAESLADLWASQAPAGARP
ncbi:NAD(P)-dependent oxidoreductase [Streptomyces sp. E11-3]|uniref:NAD-dependent epimerase/dehydratase family protein n=1 Tax=Streptomyces sp. E11-3 TaxID=3110112 RepID=UPI00397FDD67